MKRVSLFCGGSASVTVTETDLRAFDLGVMYVANSNREVSFLKKTRWMGLHHPKGEENVPHSGILFYIISRIFNLHFFSLS